MSMAAGHIAQTDLSLEASTGFARARLGLIIPSSNRLSEPHFQRFVPADVAVHTTRLQMTGVHNKPLGPLLEDVSRAASGPLHRPGRGGGPARFVHHPDGAGLALFAVPQRP